MPNFTAKGLLDWLDSGSDMSCAEARAQIPALVEAEARGVNADADPQFARLLVHIECCAVCLTEYRRQSEAGK